MIKRSKLTFIGPPPRITLHESESLLSLLKTSDIASLKKVARPTPDYEFYSQLILALFDLGPQKKITPDGVLVVSYWSTLQKLLFNQFMKIVKSF